MPRPIPEGFHTVTPQLTIRGAAQAIDFYKKAFGAEELVRMTGPDGKTVAHAELKIGDSIIFVSDEFPGAPIKSPASVGGTTSLLNLYVEDVDKAFAKAVAAGGKETMPVSDMFWGDRYGQFTDPFGYTWALATHKEDVAADEMERRAKEFWAQMQTQRKTA